MISACILAKNEEKFITRTISSVKPFVQEILVADDYSTDDTVKAAKEAGATVYSLGVNISIVGFAEALNWLRAKATQEWVLWLDGDELLGEPEHLQTLTRFPNKDAWALPRRKWTQYPLQREELEVYPDWQVRFCKNKLSNKLEGEMHVRFKGDKIHYAYRGPHIDHLQYENRTTEKKLQRENLYPKLAALQGVSIIGGKVLEKQ